MVVGTYLRKYTTSSSEASDKVKIYPVALDQISTVALHASTQHFVNDKRSFVITFTYHFSCHTIPNEIGPERL